MGTAEIQIKEIGKVYEMGSIEVEALKGVSFNIEKQEFVAIMGPSGSGKSTLMHILGCLLQPSFGEYILTGKNISDMTETELAKIRNNKIGFVFQQFNLLPRYNNLQNVEVPMVYKGVSKSKRREIARKTLKKVGLGHRLDHRPNEISGGQKQRVAIARSLVNDPTLILADEPTGNVDTATGDEIMDIFHKLNNQGHTIVLVTHEEDIAEHARRIIHLKDGKIVEDEVLT